MDPNVPESKYIEYGKQFPSVVHLVHMEQKEGKFFIANGSAVVISPNWALTAAHVVEKAEGDLILIKDKKYYVSELHIVHPERPKNYDADIALIKLKTRITLDEYPALYKDKDELGKECSMVGFGATGTLQTGKNKDSDGIKRGGKNKITKIVDGNFLESQVTKKRHTDMDFLIFHGDSGGGLFIDGKLAGILSRNYAPVDGIHDADYDDSSGSVRISTYRQWILDTMEDNP